MGKMEGGHIRQALRDATMERHQEVDGLFAHYAFDSARSYGTFLTAHARALSALEPIAQPSTPRLPLLVDDLSKLGRPVPAPLIVASDGGDAFRWGVSYALEGSRLGGAMLARRVPEGLPRSYLSAVHEKGGWAAFTRRLDAAAPQGDQAWIAQAVRGAHAAFSLFALAGAEGRESAGS